MVPVMLLYAEENPLFMKNRRRSPAENDDDEKVSVVTVHAVMLLNDCVSNVV